MSNTNPYGQHQTSGFQPPSASAPPQPPTTLGGTRQPPSSARPGKSGFLGPFTAVAAALALLLSVVAVVLAWNAGSKASAAIDKASAAQPAATAAPQGTTAGPAPTDTTQAPAPTDTGTGAVPELNAQTRYEVKYTDQTLRISAATPCSPGVSIDLDEPRVNTGDTQKDLAYARPCSTDGGRISLVEGVQGALADSGSVQPTDCADLIRTSPLAAGAQPIRTGQVYCLNTSLDAARSQATTWKMVVLTVTAMAQDGTVTFKVTAWDIPV